MESQVSTTGPTGELDMSKFDRNYNSKTWVVVLGKKRHYVQTSSPVGAANIIFQTLDVRELYYCDGIVRSRKPGELRSVVVWEAK